MAPVGRGDPRPELRLLALPVALALQIAGLSGCSGSPFAERLSRSFPSASESPLPGAPGAVEAGQGVAVNAGGTAAAGRDGLGRPPGAQSSAGAGSEGQRARPGTKASGAATNDGPTVAPPTVARPSVGGGGSGSAAKPNGATTGPSAGGPAVAGDQPAAASKSARINGGGIPTGTALGSSSSPPSNPVPYRVTLRLPRADPAAPAEVLTRALRAAGVPFEVETIERMAPSATATPAASGKPAPALPAAAR